MDWSAAVVIKTIVYVTCLTAGGGALFLAIFGNALSGVEVTRVARFARGMAVAGVGATVVRIMILGAELGDAWSGMWDWSMIQVVLAGSEGQAAALRCAGLVAVAALSYRSAGVRATAVLGSLAIAGSFALTGHGTTIGPGVVPRVIVTLHVLGVSYWIGALVPLFGITGQPDHTRAGAILRRFGDVAVVAVGGLVAAGAALLWLLLGSLNAIVTTDYGQLVLLKLAGVVGLLLTAAVNKFRLTPAVASGDKAAAAALRRSIAAEMALAVAVLALTAIFTTVTGPPQTE